MNDTFRMEALPNEPFDLRLEVIREMMHQGLSFNEARIREDQIHAQRCVFESGKVPKWKYGRVSLFETDPKDRHTHEARLRQLDSVREFLVGLSMSKETQSAWKSQLESNLEFAKKVLEEREVSSKGIFQCPGCKSQDVDTEQKQTRSADEPMTIFCECRECHRKFVRQIFCALF